MPVPSMLFLTAKFGRLLHDMPSCDKTELCFSTARQLSQEYGWDEEELKRLILKHWSDHFSIQKGD